MKQLLFCLILITSQILPQDENISLNDFNISLDNSKMTAVNTVGEIQLEMSFSNPSVIIADLDGDTSDEFIVVDSARTAELPQFTVYIFNTIESFYLVDSLVSGTMQPYYTESEEVEGVVLVTGNSDFSLYDTNNEGFLPLSFWKFDAGEIYEVNDEIYEIYINENDILISTISDYYGLNGESCLSSEKMKGAIASVYVNYLHAGEHSLATQFIKNYYLCPDLDTFRSNLNKLSEYQEY